MGKTEDNLKAAFAGESQARNKYDFYAKVARKEGYNYIADIFEETALNEMQHAKDELKLLKGIGDTKANLKAAVEGEGYEIKTMYPEFAKIAEKEGNAPAAAKFRMIAKVEAEHKAKYAKLLEMVENGTVWKRDKPLKYPIIFQNSKLIVISKIDLAKAVDFNEETYVRSLKGINGRARIIKSSKKDKESFDEIAHFIEHEREHAFGHSHSH